MREFFFSYVTLQPKHLAQVGWRNVHRNLYELPRLFWFWACQEVMRVAGIANEFLSHQYG